MDLLGTFDYTMDERGRVPLSPDYRAPFRAGIVLSQGSPDPCVVLYTPEEFAVQAALAKSVPRLHRRGRVMRRGLFGTSYRAELDGQNRVLIPAPLREYAGLSGKVIVMPTGESLEIWAPDAYDREMAAVREELPGIQESYETRERL